MAGKDDNGADKGSLEQQMKNLLVRIEGEPVPEELRKLALELQKRLRERCEPGNQQK